MTLCEICKGKNANIPATIKITYGLYQAYAAGRPHHVVELCSTCAKNLYDGVGCVPLKNLVTAGLCHFVCEAL